MQAEFRLQDYIENVLASVYVTLNAPIGIVSGGSGSVGVALYRKGAEDALRGVAVALGVRTPDAATQTEQPGVTPKPETMPSTEHHDPALIRSLLIGAFTDKELRRFCQDRFDFRPILDRCGPGTSLEDMIDALVEYCEKRDLFTELLQEAKEFNPTQYRRHFS
jgi:hypothetical protein